MKKKLLLIGIILTILFTLTGCESDSSKFKEDYESLNGEKTQDGQNTYREINIDYNNPMTYSSFKEILDKINNKDTFIVYLDL